MQRGKTDASHKNLCAQISLELHQKISEAREESGLTTAQYITQLLTEYYEMKENGGKVTMAANNTRTMAFQIPETLFQRIKTHLERETQRTGRKLTQREFVLGLIEEALEAVELPDPAGVYGKYPHELSGGMLQRAMIAAATVIRPKDCFCWTNPTTALDVTIQAQILELMKDLQKKTQMGIIFITHNLGVVAEICDKVSVMYAGKIVEQAR